MGNICCVTGHRPSSFPWNFWDPDSVPRQKYLQVMASAIDHAIREDGVDRFIAGGAIGADTDFAETVLHYRDCIHEHIRLEIAVPCPNQNLTSSSPCGIIPSPRAALGTPFNMRRKSKSA